MSIFETPPTQRQHPSGVFAQNTTHSNNVVFSELPAELRTATRSGTHPSQSFGPTSQQVPPGASVNIVAVNTQDCSISREEDVLRPVSMAAKAVTEIAAMEARYPQLDEIVSQGQSAEYDLMGAYAWDPYVRTAIHTIPDAIFEQYNRATSHTMLGLFAELQQAWITVDNRLYMWDYATQQGFQGYEGNVNTITAVKLMAPKPGVFTTDVTYVLALGTAVDVLLLGLGASPNSKGGFDVTVYETRMNVPTRGLDVTIIEGSKSSGRVFFAGKGDNDVYEITYQAEETWFHGRCAKVCHTSKGVSSFAPRLPFLSVPQNLEFVAQIVVDDSRNLLYTLSSKSTIRVFNIRSDGGLPLSVTHSFSHTLSNIRVMIGTTSYLKPDTPIISISPVPAAQARRIHLIATTTSGCRLYLSAAMSEYGYGNSDAPTSMQVVHVRFPPPPPCASFSNNVRCAKVFPPGYVFCFLDKGSQADDLVMTAPDPAKIMHKFTDAAAPRVQLIETGMKVALESRVEACELVTPSFAATRSPVGFGNETQMQFDLAPTEIAILTNSGIHMIRRRRLVEIFDAMLRYGSSSSPHGLDVEVRRFFDTYGRAEGCASALAVACGASQECIQAVPTKATDHEIVDMARRFFIEFGGKPLAENLYDTAVLPSLDQVKVSGRAEGLTLYISRIVKPLWKASIISETISLTGASVYSSSVPTQKLRSVQEQLMRLASFLQENRNFIAGLSATDSLMYVGNKVEEVANQAEHRMLHSLITLIENMIEGISFVLFLFDDRLDDIILSLVPAQKEQAVKISYAGLFSTNIGQCLAKDLVNAIVNRNIAAGMNVDTIADALRRRCGSFCSSDDVIQFKAIEQIRKSKQEQDVESKGRALRESLRLYEEAASTITMDTLRETIKQYQSLGFFDGAVHLALTVAREADRGNLALLFLDEPPGISDPNIGIYSKRVECYQLAFQVLEALDLVQSQSPGTVDGMITPTTRVRNETLRKVYASSDELFHNHLYDWLCERGQSERLLEVESSYVLAYLQRRSTDCIQHASLLWQYHARRNDYFKAAEVLHELAQSKFTLTLGTRLEFFSRARAFCKSYGALATEAMNELNQNIQEELDVALIQDEVLRRIRDDHRIKPEKKANLEKELDSYLMTLSELYNKYASPYGYMECCLTIFQSADFRGQNEIKRCWEQLITNVHAAAIAEDKVQPFEMVADTIRRLGQRFVNCEHIFPPVDLIFLLESYSHTYGRDISHSSWVIDTLLDAGIPPETVLHVLEEMFYRNETPFQGTGRRKLVRDAVAVARMWFLNSIRSGSGTDFKPATVRDILAGLNVELSDEGTVQLLQEIERKSGLGLGY